MQQKRLACSQEIGNKRYDEDLLVHLTIYDVPASLLARVAVPEFVCEVACASGFAWSMDDDVPWDTRSIVQEGTTQLHRT